MNSNRSRMCRSSGFALLMALGFLGRPALAQTNTPAPPLVARPPQFIALAFDGSQSLDMWNETRQFTKEMRAQNKDVRFTYFISGVYFLGQKNKTFYKGPGHLAGHSDIGFGEDGAYIALRNRSGEFGKTRGSRNCVARQWTLRRNEVDRGGLDV